MNKRLHPDVVISIIGLIFAAVMLFQIHGYPDDVKMFPSIFLYLFMLFMAIVLVRGIKRSVHTEGVSKKEFWCSPAVIHNPIITAVLVIIYVTLIYFLGFYISTALFMLITMLYYGSRKWMINLAVTTGMLIFCYVLFEILLSVQLPAGIILE